MLFLLAPLMLVPLGVALVAPAGAVAMGLGRAWRALPAAGTASAALLTVALVFRPGALSLALAVPWLACTVALALGGVARALGRLRAERGGSLVDGLVADAGLVFLAVGGGWAVLSAGGLRPLGFTEPIVLLTAVHFHYSGFVMATLAAWLAGRRRDSVTRAVAVGVVAGVPLVAGGIVAGGVADLLGLELAAAAVLGLVGIALGVLQAQAALAGTVSGGPERPVPRVLLGVSGLALVVGMVLAVAYPLGRWLGEQWLDIPMMAATHGVLNAVGFGLLGLLAWTLHDRREALTAP